MIEPTARPRYAGVERRVDLARRARVAAMTREELERELLTHELTGLPNRRAWVDWRRLLNPAYVAVIDVDGLKWVNDAWGHAAGDALLVAVATALEEEGVGAFHVSGDEFAVPFDRDLDAWEVLARVQRRLRRAEFEVPGVGRVTGARFSFGVGPGDDLAERRLRWIKGLRAELGLRAERGDRPPGLRVVGEDAS